MKYKNCRKCGYANPMENRYCSECGTAFRNMVPREEQVNNKKLNKKVLAIISALTISLTLLLLGKWVLSGQPTIVQSEVSCSHVWQEADCVTPRMCNKCGETSGVAVGHKWVEATCTMPKTCEVCGEKVGTVLEHQWIEATYSSAKTCTICQMVEGEPLNNPLEEAIRTRLPIITFSISSEQKVYGYDDSELTQKNDKYYFKPSIDEIVITNISENGMALEVRYPSSITQSGYRTLWFPIDDIIPITELNISSQIVEEKTTTYRFSENGSSLVHYGSMDAGNKFDILGIHESGYKVVIYSIYDKTIYGLDVDDKLALVKTPS